MMPMQWLLLFNDIAVQGILVLLLLLVNPPIYMYLEYCGIPKYICCIGNVGRIMELQADINISEWQWHHKHQKDQKEAAVQSTTTNHGSWCVSSKVEPMRLRWKPLAGVPHRTQCVQHTSLHLSHTSITHIFLWGYRDLHPSDLMKTFIWFSSNRLPPYCTQSSPFSLPVCFYSMGWSASYVEI